METKFLTTSMSLWKLIFGMQHVFNLHKRNIEEQHLKYYKIVFRISNSKVF